MPPTHLTFILVIFFTQITSEIEDKIQCGHDKTCHNNRKTSDDETFHNTKITEPQNININDLLGMENFDWLFTRVWTQKEENEPDTEKEAFVMDDQSGSGHVMSEPQAQPKLTVKVPYQRKHTRESYATSNAKMLHTGRSNNHTRREDKNYSNHGYSEKEMEYSGQHSVQLGKQNRSRNSNSGQYVPNLTRNTLEFYESEGTNFDTSIFETDEEKLNRELWLEEEKYYYDFSDFKMPERDYIPTESEMNGEIYVSEPTHVLNDYSNFKTGHARTYEYSVKDNESLKITGKRQQLPLNKDEITDLQGIVEMLGKLFDDLSVNADEDVDADDVEEALHKANRIDKGKEKGRKNKESETKVPKCGCGKQGQMLEENSGMQKHDQNKSDQDSIVNCLDNYECRWKLLNF